MDTKLNNSKPVKIAGSYILAQKGQVDGRGRAEVTFKIQFSLLDAHGQTTTDRGRIRARVEVWTPGTAHSDPTLDLVYGNRPTTYQTRLDKRNIDFQGYAQLRNFFQAPDERHRGQIWYEFSLKTNRFNVDVVEWRYCYELWFLPRASFFTELYEGHKSTYWSLRLRE